RAPPDAPAQKADLGNGEGDRLEVDDREEDVRAQRGEQHEDGDGEGHQPDEAALPLGHTHEAPRQGVQTGHAQTSADSSSTVCRRALRRAPSAWIETPATSSTPTATRCQVPGTPMRIRLFLMTAMRRTPSTAPTTDPRPPRIEAPPSTTAAMMSSSVPASS